MLRQEQLITRVRELCADDPALDAALTYGSIAQGVGDEHSDIEFWLFFTPGQVPDGPSWCGRVASTLAVTVNEFGSHVAFFPGLIRGEFHFATTDDIASVGSWPALGASTDDLIVLDRRGRLREVLDRLPETVAIPRRPEEIDELCLRFANWLVLALHVTRRGEVLRAQDALNHARRHLLWMARLRADATHTWLTPSRRAETELPPELVKHLIATLDTDPSIAMRTCWRLGRELWHALATGHGLDEPKDLWHEIDRQLGA